MDYRTVRRHMREMGIQGVCPGPNRSKRYLQHRIYPYLLRGLTIERPDHVWGVDITYGTPNYQKPVTMDHSVTLACLERGPGRIQCPSTGYALLRLRGGVSRSGGDLPDTGKVTKSVGHGICGEAVTPR